MNSTGTTEPVVRHFSCWKQFLCMAFGQMTHRESLSDTVVCLNHNDAKLYHLGIGRSVTKTTLSRANETRDWRVFLRDNSILLTRQPGIHRPQERREMYLLPSD
ncbi:MAG: DUF4372 domain-containing protein [Acidobacteria bacterium]|nr:DUF4372 domain-containing protein [Acidobacteriota bacterium]